MSDTPQVINTLRAKAGELDAYIKKLERALEQAKVDMAHINASIRLFEVPPDGSEFPVHFNLGRLYRVREIGRLCQQALAENGPMDTRELALYALRARSFDETDKHLRGSIALRVVNVMRMQEMRGKVERVGKNGNALVWRKRHG
jgi:hypothetical protein